MNPFLQTKVQKWAKLTNRKENHERKRKKHRRPDASY